MAYKQLSKFEKRSNYGLSLHNIAMKLNYNYSSVLKIIIKLEIIKKKVVFASKKPLHLEILGGHELC